MTTEQPPGAPSNAPAGDSGPANPYEQLTNAYYAPNRGFGAPASSPAAWMPPPTRSPAGPIAVGLVVVVMLGFGVAFGANEFAKRELCGDVVAAANAADAPAAGTPAIQANTTGKAAVTTAAQTQSVEETRDEIEVVRNYANLLVFDGDLQDAVEDLMADADSALRLGEELKTLTAEERMDNAPRVAELTANMETHASAAREACLQSGV